MISLHLNVTGNSHKTCFGVVFLAASIIIWFFLFVLVTFFLSLCLLPFQPVVWLCFSLRICHFALSYFSHLTLSAPTPLLLKVVLYIWRSISVHEHFPLLGLSHRYSLLPQPALKYLIINAWKFTLKISWQWFIICTKKWKIKADPDVSQWAIGSINYGEFIKWNTIQPLKVQQCIDIKDYDIFLHEKSQLQ